MKSLNADIFSISSGFTRDICSLNPDAANPTLENNGADVHYETDFRSVYAQVADGWLGTDSTRLLGGNFRKAGLTCI